MKLVLSCTSDEGDAEATLAAAAVANARIDSPETFIFQTGVRKRRVVQCQLRGGMTTLNNAGVNKHLLHPSSEARLAYLACHSCCPGFKSYFLWERGDYRNVPWAWFMDIQADIDTGCRRPMHVAAGDGSSFSIFTYLSREA